MMSDDFMTETWLARRFKPFSKLEELLQKHRRPDHTYRALVIGAGLDTSKELRTIYLQLPAELKDLAFSRFSFEPFEVAAIMERLGVDYEVVVLDHSATVLASVAAQQRIPVGFFYDDTYRGARGEKSEYIKRLATTFPASVLEEAVARHGYHNGSTTHETLVLLPTDGLLQRMSFVQGEAKSSLGSVAGDFDVITAFNVTLVTADEEVPSHVASRINPDGFVCIGDYGPSTIRAPPGFKAVYSYREKLCESMADFPYAETVLLKVA